jgi:hypothetical protein
MFLDNKYSKWYFSLVKNKNKSIEGYSEKHHIIPRSLGGDDSVNNIAILTAKEHYIAHLLLTKITDGANRQKMLHAYVMIAQCKDKNQLRENKVNSRLYQKIKEESIEAKRQYRHTEEKKKLISEKLKGVPKPKFTEEHCRRISESHLGREPWNKGKIGLQKHSDETKRIKSEKMRGRMSCFDKDVLKWVCVTVDEYRANKNTKYLTVRSKEYKERFGDIK